MRFIPVDSDFYESNSKKFLKQNNREGLHRNIYVSVFVSDQGKLKDS